jgi:G:T/U-mismatch repair DNA glycosylase
MFDRLVDTAITPGTVRQIALPSTSPAYAAMPFSGKLSAWRRALLPLLE